MIDYDTFCSIRFDLDNYRDSMTDRKIAAYHGVSVEVVREVIAELAELEAKREC